METRLDGRIERLLAILLLSLFPLALLRPSSTKARVPWSVPAGHDITGTVVELGLTDGLVAHYSFDDGTATDEGGNGNDGIVRGNPSVVDGVIGNALGFDGIDDYVQLSESMASDYVSVSAWVNTTSNKSGGEDNSLIVIRLRYYGFWISLNRTEAGTVASCLHLSGGSSYCYESNGGNYNDGNWHHLVMTYGPESGFKVFIDGNLKYENNGLENTPIYHSGGGGYSIARDGNHSSDYFQGLIDEVRIYNRALTASEVQELYRQVTCSISGQVTNSSGDPFAGVTLLDDAGHTAVTDSNGNYTLSGLQVGTHTITPFKSGYTFYPASRTVSVPPDATGQDFTALDELGDTDGDGLLNAWEVHGYDGDGDGYPDVNLPAMGASPLKKDIFVEIDYMEQPGICLPAHCLLGHSHQLKDNAIGRVIAAFANAPVQNPDGTPGINLHVDNGPDSVMNPITGALWGGFSQANSLPHHDEISWDDFVHIKADPPNFSSARHNVFYYGVSAHWLEGAKCLTGMSRVGRAGTNVVDGDFIITLGGYGVPWFKCTDLSFIPVGVGVGSTWEQAGTFMHELGHCLGLLHGGGDELNYRPNYLSVMNYAFQMGGLIIDHQEGHFDYSRFDLELLDLHEEHLDETIGLTRDQTIYNYGTKYWCRADRPKTAFSIDQIDWNCDGSPDDPDVQVNINAGPSQSDTHNTSDHDELKSFDDWAHLDFRDNQQPYVISEWPVETEVLGMTWEDYTELIILHGVSVIAPGNASVLPGSTVVYTISVVNVGVNTDTYTITVNSSLGWADLDGIPSSLTLPAKTGTEILVAVSVPASPDPTEEDEIVFSAVSHANPLAEDVAFIHTRLICQVFLPVLFRNH